MINKVIISWCVFIVLCSELSWAQQSPTRPPGGRPGISSNQSGGSGFGAQQSSRGPRSLRGGSGSVGVMSGGSFDDSGVRVISVGESSLFEPIKQRKAEYGPIPPVEDEISMSMIGPMTALQFLDTLSVATGWNIVASQALETVQMQFWANDMTPSQAVAILKFNDIVYTFDEDASLFFVMTKGEHLEKEYGQVTKWEFVIRHAALTHVETALTSLLSAKGRVISDPRTATILVMDTKDNIEQMKMVVAKLDQHRESRTYALKHIDGEGVFDTVELLLSEGGRVNFDPRTNTYIVVDRPQQHNDIAKILQTLDKPLETRAWILNYADPVLVGEEIALLIPEGMGTITINEGIHQVTVSATPERIETVAKHITLWDKKRQQVQIEAYLATVSTNIIRDFGVNWSYLTTGDGGPLSLNFGSVNFGDGGGGNPDTTVSTAGAVVSYATNSQSLGSMLSFLETSGDATILAHPRITVQDGELARFENTTQVPFANSTTNFLNSNNNSTSTVSFQFIDVGTILEVVPRIAEEGNILMDISAEDSSFVIRTLTVNDTENDVPEKTQNKAITQVLIRDQETIVIGGLRTDNFLDTQNKVPILGDIPILGRAFRSSGKDHQHKELLIFITPTIITEVTQPETVRLAMMDEYLAETMRIDDKSDFQRGLDSAIDHENQLMVSIGQQGGVFVDGAVTTMPALRNRMVNDPGHASTVVIRSHPRAPGFVAVNVAELAMEAGLKVQYEDRFLPFTPLLPKE